MWILKKFINGFIDNKTPSETGSFIWKIIKYLKLNPSDLKVQLSGLLNDKSLGGEFHNFIKLMLDNKISNGSLISN